MGLTNYIRRAAARLVGRRRAPAVGGGCCPCGCTRDVRVLIGGRAVPDLAGRPAGRR